MRDYLKFNFQKPLSVLVLFASILLTSSSLAITITSPVGGENWAIGSTHYITWTGAGSTMTNVYYTTNNGTSWIQIEQNNNGLTSPYSWIVPNSPSTSCKVWIRNAANTESGYSPTVFTISSVPVILTAPAGGETWMIGNSYNITWTPTDAARWLDYSTDSGNNWTNIAGSISGLPTPYAWVIPNIQTSTAKVRVILLVDGRRDSTHTTFTITTPLAVNSPNGGENWVTNSVHSITWTALHNPVTNIYYTTNDGTSWILENSNSSGFTSPYSWTVPNYPSTSCRVKVTDLTNTERDSSNAVFTISVPPVLLTAPNGGEAWAIGAPYSITWTPTDPARWLDYSTDNGNSWINIAGSVSPGLATPYSWTVPNTPSTQTRVRVMMADGRRDSSDAAFSIALPMTVTSPNGGENWVENSVHSITWTALHNPVTYLFYSTNNGTSWVSITHNAGGITSPYSWTLPGVATTSARVKITNETNTEFDSSNAAFTISATPVVLTAPNGSENWAVGATYNITWTPGADYANTLYYSTNNETNWIQIANSSSPGLAQPYSWVIPNTPSALCRVKVVMADGRKDSSDAVFNIAMPMAVTSPNGGENWLINSTHSITWTAIHDPVTYIFYSTNNGTSWISLAHNSGGITSPYSWILPSAASAQTRVKIQNEANTERDSSDAPFAISLPPVVIGSPNGGETWAIGATYTITWTPANDYANNLYYTTNNGTNWTLIASSNSPGLSTPYSWNIPNIPSTQCRIKMVTSDGRVDSSDAVFNIVVPMTVTAPNGGENWVLGTQHNMTWTAIHDPVTYLTYSTDNGVSWLPILHSSGGITSPYTWTVPSTVSTQCRVKVYNETNTERDSSDAVFTISRPPVNLTAPNGGENWLVNSSYNITWSPNDPAYQLSYSLDGGNNWTSIASSANPGLSTPYTWLIPNLPSTLCKIKVELLDGRTDISDNNFTITLPMTLTAPLGGENWVLGSLHDITWNALHDPVTYLNYSTDNGTSWVSILHNSGGISSPYHWTVPNAPSTQCKIRIANETFTERDSTRNPFTISRPPINVTAPNGGENFYYGQTTSITWSPTDPAFQLAYSTDNGNNWNEIASSALGITTPYPWTIPSTPSTQCLVRVFLADGRLDYSDNVFSITNPMTLGAPNGGENFVTGSTTSISWTALHNPVCYINYTTDNGVSWLSIAQNSPGGFTSPYSWTVPNTPSSQCRVRVTDANSFERDSSDNVFTISLPPVNVTAPNGGENFYIGGSTNISWAPTSPAFQIAFSTDNGTNWTEIASSGTGISSPYPWTIPATPSTQCKVRVFLLDGRWDVSDNVFSISIPMTLTSPNGGESYVTGSTHDITWTALHDPVSYIYYSTNNGLTWISIAQNPPTGYASPYHWTVPLTPSTLCLVKVNNANGVEVDSSNAPFSITVPPVVLTAPNGGENFYIGGNTSITWSPSSPAQYIYLSTNNGSTWSVIQNSNDPGISTPFPWPIPNITSTQCRVKVVLLDGRIDSSDAVFSITRPMVLTAPVGGENWQVGTTHSITWTALHDPMTYIYYSTNDGATWISLLHNAGGLTSPTSWTIPNTPTSQARVLVRNESYTEADSSHTAFTISSPPVALISPNGTENFFIGGNTNITWTPTSPAQYIYLSTNNGTNWSIIQSSVNGITTPFNWVIPNSPSTLCRVKITLLDGRTDSSDAAFSITTPMTLTAPVGGETWATGSTHSITWNALHNAATYLYYSTNNGVGWISIAHNAAGLSSPYSWTVPTTAGTSCRVLVYDESTTERDSSHAVFTISVPPVVLTAPNGGSNYFIGSNTSITWSPTDPARWLDYSTNNGSTWINIAGSASPGLSTPYPWTIPNSPSAQCIVRVIMLDGRRDSSDVAFTITIPTTLISPVGGENWLTGSTHSITWSALHNPVNYIYYSTNNGIGWLQIAYSPSGFTSPYAWTIPSTPATLCRVKVYDAANTERDSSHAVFTISVPPVTLTSPAGGESWITGSSHSITWTPTDPARWLDYSTDNGNTWINIAGSASPGLSTPYPWTLPNAVCTTTRVRVILLDNRRDSCHTAFSIVNPVVLNSPVGGETWSVGSTYNISWTANHNAIAYIYYTTNNGSTWIQVAQNPVGFTSPYSWTIPNSPSATCRVKVYDFNNTERDSSHATFTISAPVFGVTAPNGGENWFIGSSHNITWNVSTVADTIWYSTNNGSTWITIASSLSPGISTPYSWTIPNAPSAQCRVKVRLHDARKDSSDAVFSITAPVTLLTPNGGENWSVSGTYDITWSALHDPVAFIYYSTNNGSTWINVAQNPVGFTSPYHWVIPNTPNTNCRVLVYNYTNTERDSSNAIFTISAAVAPSDPTGLTVTEDLPTGNIVLNWTASTGTFSGYHIYRYTTGHFTPPGTGTLIGTVSAPTTTYTDTNVISTGAYFYRVTAY